MAGPRDGYTWLELPERSVLGRRLHAVVTRPTDRGSLSASVGCLNRLRVLTRSHVPVRNRPSQRCAHACGRALHPDGHVREERLELDLHAQRNGCRGLGTRLADCTATRTHELRRTDGVRRRIGARSPHYLVSLLYKRHDCASAHTCIVPQNASQCRPA